jgi:predicted nucleotidyltransferase
MDQREVIEKLIRYRYLLSKHFDIDKIILFGSYAKGLQRTDSDIDVAVVVKQVEGDYFTYTPLLWQLRREIDDRIEPILFEACKDKSGFLKAIVKEGIEINST